MKELLNELLNGVKTLKNAEVILNKNNIEFTHFESYGGLELQVTENSQKYHRIRVVKKQLVITTMVKHTIDTSPENMARIEKIFNSLSYK
ncbi:MAG: hypothetical protein LIR50_04275 [Bacillota bacterium]|nr:hypothetical protein [Bacillota bacterium]